MANFKCHFIKTVLAMCAKVSNKFDDTEIRYTRHYGQNITWCKYYVCIHIYICVGCR